MNRSNRRNFSPEFKLEAAQLNAGLIWSLCLICFPVNRLAGWVTIQSVLTVKHHYRVNADNSPALPHVLKRQFSPVASNRVWCGDISFIRLQGKWCYLALVVDLYSRRIIGSALYLSADAGYW